MTKGKSPSKVALATFGCKVNQCDSAALSGQLAQAGFELAPFGGHADVYIINTCTVTAYADFQARQLIRRALRANPDARVIVTGCLAQTQANAVAGLEGVSHVVGNDQKQRIPELLLAPRRENAQILVGNIFAQSTFQDVPETEHVGRTRAFFKIQDGCNAFCSYCIIPFARGKSRSLPLSDFLAGAQNFVRHGYREIVLTGIHLGFYGQDFDPPIDLAQALELVLRQNPQTRFRLSSIEPNEISDHLLDLFGRHDNLCPHLHIPLQSGDDAILLSMKRRYDSAFYRSLIEKVSRTVPDIAVGIDVMVGFPGEGDREFSSTLNLLTDLPLAYLHVFPYSERPGTAAVTLQPKVPEKIKKERAAILRTLGAVKKEAFARRFFQRTLPVLVEKTCDKKTGLAKGFSSNYLPVVLDKPPASLVNKILHVQIEDFAENKLTGRIVCE